MVNRTRPTLARRLGPAARAIARVPWRVAQRLPLLPQQRIQLLLGRPPLDPDGAWTVMGPAAVAAAHPTPELVDLALDAARRAARLRLDGPVARAAARASDYAAWLDAFPGEHYRLLAGLVDALDARTVVEIGTYTGASALTFLDRRAPTRIITYDIVAWDEIAGTLLEPADFDGGRLEQRIGDLADPSYWAAQRDTVAAADLLFLDGPKDGVFEPLILDRLARLATPKPVVLAVDDIRFLEMVEPWARLPAPKLDLTSFGHWSGTGIASIGGPGPG